MKICSKFRHKNGRRKPPEKRENCGSIVTFTDILGEEY